ncbi:MAG TPA: 4-alpha-glucanotransferase [Candidatus Faecalicoccus intestinipullorum]|nr:4-alpha-glucanotransferase [Candidatus Faecalicoccus intestinipullorum]
MKREAGILCPMFSVPGNQGIGDFGTKTLKMIDCIADAGYKVWQMLPLQVTGFTHSPYQNLSSFAGDPIYINIDRLSEMGLVTQSSVINCNKFKNHVDYVLVREFKEKYFERAFKTFKKVFDAYEEEYNDFLRDTFWLEDWVTFQLFHELHDGASWNEWDEEYRNYPEEHDLDLSDYQERMDYLRFLQFIFYKQLSEIVMYAHSKGLEIMGDIPFYVDYDSADVWANKELFLLDEKGKPEFVAGCPPDYFSKTGQRWGMPIYNFEVQKKDGYQFWCQRVHWTNRFFDKIRIDHFRAFDTYWKIPAECPTAVDGKWILGPAEKLLDAILKACPDVELIAEDLGMIRKEVTELADVYKIPGMEVLLFKMEAKQLRKPIPQHKVLYTGTHDNATIMQDYVNYDNNRRISLRRFFKKRGYEERAFYDIVCHFALDSKADLVILPIWDICGYKEEARINTPGTVGDQNWTWKLKDFKTFPDELMKTKVWIEQAGR